MGKKSLYSVAFIFLGTLLILTISRTISNGNPYIYSILPFAWFLGLFFREIKIKKKLLKNEWIVFKKKKWINIGLIILLLIILNWVIQASHPIFNKYIPDKYLATYNFSLETGLGLLFTLLTGLINIVVAFVEEITYRYDGMYIFRSKKWFCIFMLLVSSILFGFSHYYNFGGSFLATGPYILAGLVLGLFYLFSKNIWVPILGHMVFNSIDILSGILLLIAHLIAIFK